MTLVCLCLLIIQAFPMLSCSAVFGNPPRNPFHRVLGKSTRSSCLTHVRVLRASRLPNQVSSDSQWPGSLNMKMERDVHSSKHIHGKVINEFYFHLSDEYARLPCSIQVTDGDFINPECRWFDHNGKRIQDGADFLVRDFRVLVFKHVLPQLSGSYSCICYYRRGSSVISERANHSIRVYHWAEQTMKIMVQYMTLTCDKHLAAYLYTLLLKNLSRLLLTLRFQVHVHSWKCRPSAKSAPMFSTKLTHVYYFSFMVVPYTRFWEDDCVISGGKCCPEDYTSQMKIVYQTIRWYFAMQKPSASMDPPVMLPVFYVRHSLWTLRLERCRPGFGKDQEKICPRCCVACTPGTFSSTQSTLCQVCALGFYNPYFGAISCEVCPAWKTTKHTGSQRLQDCYVEPNFINLGIAASGSLSVFLIIIAIIALRMRSCSKPVEAEMMKRHKPNMIKKAQEFEKAIDSINLTEERKKLQPCSTGTLFDSRSSISDVETIVTENSLAVSSTSWGSAGSSTEDDAVATAHTSFSMDPVE